MSEDADGKVGVRRQRTTRSERRRPSRQGVEAEGRSWPVGATEPPPSEPEREQPDAFDTLDEPPPRKDAWDEASDTGPTDPPPSVDGEPAAVSEDEDDDDQDDRRLTAEIDVTPLQLPPEDENAKTLPRLRLEGLAARIAAAEAAELARSSRPPAPDPDDALGFGTVTMQRTVVIAPSRIIGVGTREEENTATAPLRASSPAPASRPPPPRSPVSAPAVDAESFEAFAEPDGAPVDRSSGMDGEDGGLPIVDVEDEVADVDATEAVESLLPADHERGRTPPPPPPPDRVKAAALPAAPPPKRPPPPPAAQSQQQPQAQTAPLPVAAAAAPRVAEDDRQKRRQVRQWWERFFSEDYLLTVLPPAPAQIAKQVDFLVASLGLERGATVLDVGCGLGLHSIELCRRGFLVVGLDLSLAMITRAAEAAQRQAMKINFVHADIREMEFDGAFDGVICMGTTFGFFDDDANRDVLTRLHQALKPGGRILLDVVNRDYAIALQPNLVWFEGDECVVMEESDFNYFNSRLSVKRTMMREDGRQSQADYAIRLYSLHELGQMMQQMGFRVIEVSGQEAIRGAFFGSCSPRILMLGERRPATRPSAVLSTTSERTSAEGPRPPAAADRLSQELPRPPKTPT
jgi:SAM-dependent methyltransferase